MFQTRFLRKDINLFHNYNQLSKNRLCLRKSMGLDVDERCKLARRGVISGTNDRKSKVTVVYRGSARNWFQRARDRGDYIYIEIKEIL